MMVYCMVFGIAFLAFGLIFCTGRLLVGIPGWTQMSPDEQKRIRVLPLCRNIGGMICLAGGILLAVAVAPAFLESGIRWAMTGWFALCIADLVFIHKSARYVRRPGK